MSYLLKAVSFCVLLSWIAFPALSQSASQDDSYRETLKVMFTQSGQSETFSNAIDQILEMYKQQFPDIDQTFLAEFREEFSRTSLDDLVDRLVPVYQSYLTQEDLKQIIAFYNTPVGKKFAANTPALTSESMQVGQQWGMEVAEKVLLKMENQGKE